MKSIFVQASCGCCSIEMKFHNEESAQQAFSKVGFSSSATIVDDEGTVHEGVDTFYGFSANEEQEGNHFERLLRQFQ